MSQLNPGYYDEYDLRDLGFASIGVDVRISRASTVVGERHISIADHVRIDPYVIITASAPMQLGSFIHIGGSCSLAGGAGISIGDFSTLSHGVRLFSTSDDYSGVALTNPTVPSHLTNVTKSPVSIGRHVIIGAGSVVLPGVHIADGCAIGALSLVSSHTQSWSIYVGMPARRIKDRSKELLQLEPQVRKGVTHDGSQADETS